MSTPANNDFEDKVKGTIFGQAIGDGIRAVTNQGGDADTNGAVAGALLGARYGYNAIPERLRNGLIGHDALMQRTDALLRLVNERDERLVSR